MLKWLFPKDPAPPTEIPRIDPKDRIYAIGDIHGAHDLLDVLFEKVVEDAAAQTDMRIMKIVFLGDYIDRGDNSREVLERLVAIQEGLPDQVEFLMGNHESAMLGFLEEPYDGANWIEMGGRQTLFSFGVRPPMNTDNKAELLRARDGLHQEISPYLDFLKSLKRYYWSGDYVFVHAGIDPDLPVDAQKDSALLWGHSGFISGKGRPGLRVVHGHYAAYEPVLKPHRVCVDTGAYYSGRLTAIRLDDDEALLAADRMVM